MNDAEICARCANDIAPGDLKTCCGRPFCTACYALHVDGECELAGAAAPEEPM